MLSTVHGMSRSNDLMNLRYVCTACCIICSAQVALLDIQHDCCKQADAFEAFDHDITKCWAQCSALNADQLVNHCLQLIMFHDQASSHCVGCRQGLDC